MPFKQFQIQDYARAALHDGLILAHDTGLGKGIAALVWPLLKLGFTALKHPSESGSSGPRLRPHGAILIVAPGGLH